MATTSRAEAQNLKGSVRLGSYLRRLRAGYGYSLRRVEERARAEGGEIDNSQLSRYEKGICYPSFDKLRVLASVFNVSIQSFSDIVDLEAFEDLKPENGDPATMLADGTAALRAGDNGRAFALYERALELLGEATDGEERREEIARARVYQATALSRLGKLALAEQELRNALRLASGVTTAAGDELQARALIALANIHADQGDSLLGEIESERAHALARALERDDLAAMARHTAGRVLADRKQFTRAVEVFREAAQRYEACGREYEAIRVRINIGAAYIDLGKAREGIRLLRQALDEAKAGSHRRLAALAWHQLGQAYFGLDDRRRARGCFRESDALAIYNDEKQTDILFLNAYYEWRMAVAAENPTRERIAFGRLKALRSSLERRFPEVEAFDDVVEGGRRHVS